MNASGPIRIDLKSLLRSKLGGKARLVPGWLRRRLECLICQDQLNRLLEHNYPARGSDFCRGVLRDLDVSVDAVHTDRLPADGRAIFVCNHPLGGLDGMALIAFLADRYGREPRVVVNDLLMAIEPLTDTFVPVNKLGAQSRSAATTLDDAMAGDAPVLMFPAGLVSRLTDDGRVADLRWNRMFLRKAREYCRDIVPLHFNGHNSPGFYRAARRRVALGLRFNFEMVLLPREVFASRGNRYTITCGHPVAWQSIGTPSDALAEQFRQTVYNL